MKNFSYSRPENLQEVSRELEQGATLIAGGTDLLGGLKADIYPDYPKKLTSIKGVKDLNGIEEKDGKLYIGATTKLSEIAENKTIAEKLPCLAEAAHSVATPLVRNLGTIGGNVCQDVRCWFYRYPHEVGGRLVCARKGGEQCYAIHGDSRYHSVFGGMKTGFTPCALECPAGTDIPAYMSEIRKGNWDNAADIIMQYNPFPMLTSRVCPHTCQGSCNQCANGDSVNIHAVERALGDHIMENTGKFYAAPSAKTGKSAGIIGAGPAGLTAAFFLRKQGHKVVVYDKMQEPGGVLMYGIPEYRLPKHYMRSVTEALKGMGIEFVMNTTVGSDISVDEIKKQNDTIFIDTGAWKQPLLGIEGENLTEFGLNFLVEVNQFMRRQIGKHVLVCGGGNVAMDVALTAKRLGAEKVTLACLEQRNEMPASEEEIARAIEEGVEVQNGWGLKKVLTNEDGKVCGLESKKCTSVRDEDGKFNPQYNEDDVTVFEADSIILATGQRVDLDFLGDLRSQITTERGLISVGEYNDTKKEGVYAGGDAVTGPSTAIRAIRTGANAARRMTKQMGSPLGSVITETGFLHSNKARVGVADAVKEKDTPVEKRSIDVEDSSTISKKDAIEEAGRCMNCGCYSVNASDLTPVLIALDAVIQTTKREISAEKLFTEEMDVKDMLEPGEVVTGFIVPIPENAKTHYNKFRLRNSIDFAVVSLASSYQVINGKIENAKVVFGGVAPVPMRRKAVEDYLNGKEPTAEAAEKAAEIAVEGADPFEKNEYKLPIIQSLLKDSIIGLQA